MGSVGKVLAGILVGLLAGYFIVLVIGAGFSIFMQWPNELFLPFMQLAGALTGGAIGLAWSASRDRRNARTSALVVGLVCLAVAAYGGFLLYAMDADEPNSELDISS